MKRVPSYYNSNEYTPGFLLKQTDISDFICTCPCCSKAVGFIHYDYKYEHGINFDGIEACRHCNTKLNWKPIIECFNLELVDSLNKNLLNSSKKDLDQELDLEL